MVNAGRGVSGEPRGEGALIPAVPAAAQRDREIGSWPLRAQPSNDWCGLFGREARAVPAVETKGARECGLRAAADPDRDRLHRLWQHAHVVDHRLDVARLKTD